MTRRFRALLRLSLSGIIIFVSVLLPTLQAAAYTQDDFTCMDLYTCEYVQGDGLPTSCGTTATSTGGGALAKGSSVYILGDSITARAESAYKKAFGDKGITPQINAVVGRSWVGEGNNNGQKGSDGVVADANLIKAAGGIIIALGSNGGVGGNPVADVVSAVRKDNPSAPIWWVNTTGTTYSGKSLKYLGTFNKALDGAASSNNIQVINWATAVAPGSNPYTTPGTPAADPNHLLEDGLHPNSSGVSLLSNIVVAAVAGGASTTSSAGTASTAASCCETSSTTLQGSDHQQQAFNFFIGKGLTAPQAAGIIGNLMQEHHLQTSDTPGGLGIAQWIGGRATNLRKFASNRNLPVTDLGVQLNFLWTELTTSYKSVYKALLQTSSVDDTNYSNNSTINFMGTQSIRSDDPRPEDLALPRNIPGYESPGWPFYTERVKFARAALKLYGASATTATGGAVTGTSCTTGNGSIGTGKGSFTDNTTIKYPGVDKMLQRAISFADLKGAMFAKECINGGNPNGVNCTGWCAHVAATTWGYQTGTYGSFSTSALGQWEYMKSTGHAHPGDRNPPVGALLFYDTGGQPGHVVVYLGNNKVISNDVYNSKSGVDGGVYIADAKDMENGTWHFSYFGWADPYYSGHIGNSKL